MFLDNVYDEIIELNQSWLESFRIDYYFDNNDYLKILNSYNN
jgi:hypothetical protein